MNLPYPEAPRASVVDEYFGVEVNDPYRPLEDSNIPETAEWLAAQAELCESFLSQCEWRQTLIQEFTEKLQVKSYRPAFLSAGQVYFWRKGANDKHAQLCRLDGESEVTVLNPNDMSEDGSRSLSFVVPSPDGAFLAYCVSNAGSDWITVRVRDLRTGQDLPDEVRWTRYSRPEWGRDGFYYSAYDPPAEEKLLTAVAHFQKVYFHRLGDPVSEDRLVFSNPEKPQAIFGAVCFPDHNFLIISEMEGSSGGNRLYCRQMDAPDTADWLHIGKQAQTAYEPVGMHNGELILHTDLKAPRYRLVSVDLQKADDEDNWREIVPQSLDVLTAVAQTSEAFAVQYLRDASSKLFIFNLDGEKIAEPPIPQPSTIFELHSETNKSGLVFGQTSFERAAHVMYYDTKTAELSVIRKTSGEMHNVETQRLHAKSADGTTVPMFVTFRRGLQLDGNNPTVVYGYGGFNVKLTPEFSRIRESFIRRGGVMVVVNARGGGEFGQEWHHGAMMEKKQNTFNDFIAAGEHMISAGYTRSERMAMMGGSNGGLLVGAVMTQRPDLFGCAVAMVGVFDMLRYHQFTIGWAWVSEYGSSDREDEFHVLHRYSPVHNVKPGTNYPATLIMTADHDDRVVPSHSYKFAAALQAAGSSNPVILRVGNGAGHGGGRTVEKLVEDEADYWSFIMCRLGMPLPDES